MASCSCENERHEVGAAIVIKVDHRHMNRAVAIIDDSWCPLTNSIFDTFVGYEVNRTLEAIAELRDDQVLIAILVVVDGASIANSRQPGHDRRLLPSTLAGL